jgi:exosortase
MTVEAAPVPEPAVRVERTHGSPATWAWAALLMLGIGFGVLFWQPFATLLRDWWQDPEAGHGLLLGPLALILAWRRGIRADGRPARVLGLVALFGAVLLRHVSGLAVELFTMRLSLLAAVIGLIVYFYGVRQVVHWWLPLLLLLLSIPLPVVVVGSLALPLQFQASRLGAALMTWRHVPVHLAGNIIQLPGRTLFVTEACSGLRSLTALLALGVLIAGIWLRSPWLRGLLILAALPVAVLLNGIRVFLTGFLVFFVSPQLGEGFMHLTEGLAIFIAAFALLGGIAWLLTRLESLWVKR